MASMPSHDRQLSLALRPPPQPDAPYQPPFVTQPSPSRIFAADRQLGNLRTTKPTHERSRCAEPPRCVEVHDRIRSLESQIQRLVIVTIGNPLLASEQFGLDITPLRIRRLHPTRFPEVYVQMNHRKAGLRR